MRKSIVKSKPFAVPQYPSARGYHTEPMVRRPAALRWSACCLPWRWPGSQPSSGAEVKAKDRGEFIAYLRNCTDRQVYGVLEKEVGGRREDYAELARNELARRGLPEEEGWT